MRYSYPITQHILSILPLCLLLLVITVTIGTSAEVIPFFRTFRAAHPEVTYYMTLLTDLGNPAYYVIYAGILLAARKHRDAKLTRFVIAYILVQLAVSFLLVRFFKIAIGRPRPGVDGLYVPWSFDSAHNSLPSGHTAEIIGSTIPLTYFFKNHIVPLLLGCYAAAIGFSRVYLEMHHTSDIFFGILLGSFSAYVIHTIWNRD
ncbi:phosphatase PAP2 family protein [Desulfovibrio mangrovi]|uniref:phosphatase PAP2 family protein n=1 Tax=Desulfovibrio mangrovi TaxID=2976983 RepID=UPI0022466886|nr:phosphatase PAP2 family protein [Desulfovibrio mangrovi]UZP68014.1 phosphatase PAP2 family protein [Desulfovibrio mangrovi]